MIHTWNPRCICLLNHTLSPTHSRQLPPPPLNDKIEGLIREWFKLVDDDSSGALDTAELAMALKVRMEMGF